MALRNVAGSAAATSLMHPWSEISMRSTLIDLVGRLEAPIEGGGTVTLSSVSPSWVGGGHRAEPSSSPDRCFNYSGRYQSWH